MTKEGKSKPVDDYCANAARDLQTILISIDQIAGLNSQQIAGLRSAVSALKSLVEGADAKVARAAANRYSGVTKRRGRTVTSRRLDRDQQLIARVKSLISSGMKPMAAYDKAGEEFHLGAVTVGRIIYAENKKISLDSLGREPDNL